MIPIQIKYLILGAGLTGLTTAYYLKDDYLTVEANNYPGGTASSTKINGFKLDNGIHVLYTRDNLVLDWIKNELNVELLEKTRKCSVWIDGRFIKFPLQYNLSDFPAKTRIKSIATILRSTFNDEKNISHNFESYSIKTFGTYLTDIFVRPYNMKVFGVPISEMNIEWMGDYVPKYSKIKMIISAVGKVGKSYGRNSKFHYPVDGGISTVSKKLSWKLMKPVLYNCSLVSLSLKNKIAELSDGNKVNYEFLINTIPLRSFLDKITDLPHEIVNSANLLRQNSTTILHILCEGELNQIQDHWLYISDKAIPFYRVTIPGNINPANCPEGHFALTLEFGGNVLFDKSVLTKSINALKAMGILNNSNIIETNWKLLDCGYVIYDVNRTESLKKIVPFLQQWNVFSTGRYGNWEYSNMEDAILNGKKIANQLLAKS